MVRQDHVEQHRWSIPELASGKQSQSAAIVVQVNKKEQRAQCTRIDQAALAEQAVLARYKKHGIQPELPTIRLHPKLLVSQGAPWTRLGYFGLTIEIPQIGVKYKHKGKFIRHHTDKGLVLTDVPLFFQMDLVTWCSMDDEPLTVIYRWSTKNGFTITHTKKVWLNEPEHIDVDDDFNPVEDLHPLGHTYNMDDAQRYTFNDWRSIVKIELAELTNQNAILDAISQTERAQLGLSHIQFDGKWGAELVDEFECTRCKDPYLTSDLIVSS